MRKFFSLIVATLVGLAANAQIYVCGAGDGLGWTPESPAEMTLSNGSYTITIKNLTEFKLSKAKGNWSTFNGACMGCGTISKDQLGKTISLTKRNDNNKVPAKGEYTLTVNPELTQLVITSTSDTPQPTGPAEIYLRGDMNSWGATNAWKWELLEEENGYGIFKFTCAAGQSINAGQGFKIADNDYFEYNLGSAKNISMDKITGLVNDSQSSDCTLATTWNGVAYLKAKANDNAQVFFSNDKNAENPFKSGQEITFDVSVSFNNASTKWEEVYAYVWNGDSKNANWPGVAMTKGAGDVWTYEASLPFDPAMVIFNNNNKGAQTEDLEFENGKQYDYLVQEYSVSYNNSVTNYETVYVYFFNDTQHNSWPGVAMTKGEDNIWTYTGALTFEPAGVIFNDGNGQQGGDEVFENGKQYGEAAQPNSITVYFDNSASQYETVYAYMWKGNGSPSNAAWPGVEMTKGDNDVWSYTAELPFDPEFVIFNNGDNGLQTDNLDFEDGKTYVGAAAVSTDVNITYNNGKTAFEKVYVFIWKNDKLNNGAYPGAEMTKIEARSEGDDMWSYSATLPFEPTNLLFSDGTDDNKTPNYDFENGKTYGEAGDTPDPEHHFSLVGTFNDWNADAPIEMTEGADNTWTYTFASLPAETEFKIIDGTGWDASWGGEGDINDPSVTTATLENGTEANAWAGSSVNFLVPEAMTNATVTFTYNATGASKIKVEGTIATPRNLVLSIDYVDYDMTHVTGDVYTYEYTGTVNKGTIFFFCDKDVFNDFWGAPEDATTINNKVETTANYGASDFFELGQSLINPKFTFTLLPDGNATVIVHGEGAGIDSIEADNNGEVYYFNLQGVRILEPKAGDMYIRVQGNKATKIAL